MQLNFFLAAAIAAIVPLIVGSIWYNPKVFGSAWMNVNGFNEEKLKEGFNMPLVFGLTLVFGYLISFVLFRFGNTSNGIFQYVAKSF
jgi:hypothetical protein